MKNQSINELLGLSEEAYENMILRYWLNYCENLSSNCIQFQKLIANRAMNKYFLTEFKKHEAFFLESLSGFQDCETITKTDYKKAYDGFVCQVFKNWNAPLLDQTKSKGTFSYRHHGILIFNSLNHN
jgi:hypothetical protein